MTRHICFKSFYVHFGVDYIECILMLDSVSNVMISQIQALAEDVEPLLAEVHDSGLLKDVEKLTKSLTRASEDLR